MPMSAYDRGNPESFSLEPYGRRLQHPEERPSGARDVTFLRFAFPTEPEAALPPA